MKWGRCGLWREEMKEARMAIACDIAEALRNARHLIECGQIFSGASSIFGGGGDRRSDGADGCAADRAESVSPRDHRNCAGIDDSTGNAASHDDVALQRISVL
jgi:hypothetical protein